MNRYKSSLCWFFKNQSVLSFRIGVSGSTTFVWLLVVPASIPQHCFRIFYHVCNLQRPTLYNFPKGKNIYLFNRMLNFLQILQYTVLMLFLVISRKFPLCLFQLRNETREFCLLYKKGSKSRWEKGAGAVTRFGFIGRNRKMTQNVTVYNPLS
jgi:hypothetical protein